MKAAQVLSAHNFRKGGKKKEKSKILPSSATSRKKDESSWRGHNSESIDEEINCTNLPLDNGVSG